MNCTVPVAGVDEGFERLVTLAVSVSEAPYRGWVADTETLVAVMALTFSVVPALVLPKKIEVSPL